MKKKFIEIKNCWIKKKISSRWAVKNDNKRHRMMVPGSTTSEKK